MPDTVDDPTPLQLAIRRAIAESGKTRDYFDSKIQKKTGKTGKPIYDIDRGKSKKPSMEVLQLIADAIGRPIHFFTGPATGTMIVPEADIPPSRSASIDDNTVEITSLDLSFSMGPGATIDDYIEEEPVKFDIGFLRQITRSPFERLRLARGVGDSMFPTLVGGDVVLIDTTQRMLNMQDRVYAVSLYGAAAIKRLRTVGPNRVLVISDNPAVENQEVSAEDMTIAGRVIWFSREL